MQEFANNEGSMQSFLIMCCWEEMLENADSCRKKVRDIATVSDEAFVLLILKNIWDDMMKVKIDDFY